MLEKMIMVPVKTFIGREDKIEMLGEFLTKYEERAQAAIIKGSAGVGKTRLVKEVLNSIIDGEILWCDCLALYEDMAYYPIKELIKCKMNTQGQKILEDIALPYRVEIGKLIPEMMTKVKERIKEIGLVLDKYRLYESIRTIIEIGDGRKIIVIDNMQWVDRETTEIIKYLLRSLRDSPIAFLFIYRQEEQTEILENFTSYISRETEVRELCLESFRYNNVKKMVKVILGEESDTELIEYIQQESGGNPFYVEEIVKRLSEAGYLKLIDDEWQFEKPVAELIPKSIEDITEKKYQSLNKDGKRILEIASVIGKFDVATLKSITGYEESHIVGAIDDIMKIGLIRERGDRIEFHEKIARDVIYKRNVETTKAKMLHAEVGEKIEEQYVGKEQDVLEELAFHYYRGAIKEKGVRYCVEAGDRAKEKYANSNAIKYYTWAQELLRNEKVEDMIKTKIDCLSKRSDVLSLIGNNKKAMGDLEQGLKEAKKIRDKKREADVKHKKIALYLNIYRYNDIIAEAPDCMRIYEESDDKAGVAKLLNTIGSAYLHLNEHEKALRNYEKSLKICREIDDKEFEARVLGNIGIIYGDLGNYHKALKIYENVVKIYGYIEDKRRESNMFNNIGVIYNKLGYYQKALKNFEQSLKIKKEIGDKLGASITIGNIGNIHVSLGNYKKGLNYFENCLKVTTNTGYIFGKIYDLYNIGVIYYHLGDYDKALRFLEDSLKMAQEMELSKREFYCLMSIAQLHLTLGRMEKAKMFIDKAYHIAESSKDMLKHALSILCEFYLEKRNLDEFDKNMAALQTLLKDIKSVSSEADVNLLLGRYYTEVKDFKKAKIHLSQALETFDGMKEKLNIGMAHYYLGDMELAERKKSDCQKHFGKSLKIFKSLGAKGWVDKVGKRLKKCVV